MTNDKEDKEKLLLFIDSCSTHRDPIYLSYLLSDYHDIKKSTNAL